MALRMVAAELHGPETQKGEAAAVNMAGEIVINRPIDVVFVADERNEPRYNPCLRRVEQTMPGPIGRGTQFRVRDHGRRWPHRRGWLSSGPSSSDPWRLASSTHMSAMHIHGTLTLDPVPAGTRKWSWEIRPRGPLRLVRPLVARMGQRQEMANWAGLKSYLEEHWSAPPGLRHDDI
jgi:hypothetical protein